MDIRNIALKLIFSARKLTSNQRVLPSFLIIGGQRCGTTSLYRYIKQHPSLHPSLFKEVHFFDENYFNGLGWYRAFFPLKLTMSISKLLNKKAAITGESSPYYLFHPLVPERVKNTLPDVKIIILLRNPVDRAYSHHQHETRLGFEKLSFEEAIEKETERLLGEKEKIISNEKYYSYNHNHYSYLSRGIYIDQINEWMKYFSREQMLIINSEDFFSDPKKTVNLVFDFLGIKKYDINNVEIHNRGNYSPIKPEIKDKLDKYFEKSNKKLYEFIGKSYSWD